MNRVEELFDELVQAIREQVKQDLMNVLGGGMPEGQGKERRPRGRASSRQRGSATGAPAAIRNARSARASEPTREASARPEPARRTYSCGECGRNGHTRRSCPKLKADDEDPARVRAEGLDLEDENDLDRVETELEGRDDQAEDKLDLVGEAEDDELEERYELTPRAKLVKPAKPSRSRLMAIRASAEAERARLARYDPNRTLRRCLEPGCVVRVLDSEREMRGHLERAHRYADTECYQDCFEAPRARQATAS